MMIAVLKGKYKFEDKLISILDNAKLMNETHIVIMTDKIWHIEIFDFMKNHKGIEVIKVGGSTYFIIKQMRIELQQVDFYI